MQAALSYVQGFGAGAGLIIAIGAQNAFVLAQSVRKNHHLAVCLTCSLCDAVLITLGVLGTGELILSLPWLMRPMAWAGAAFLAWYGFRAFRSALRPQGLADQSDQAAGLGRVLLATLAVTLLNPHVYLDTVVMLGSISSQYGGSSQHPGSGRYLFGLGAMSASFVWFFALGLGGRALAPWFRRPAMWRVLDGLVCATMWAIALALASKALSSGA